MKIALVRVRKFGHSASICRLLKWVPVYWPPHSDPELSVTAARPHCHIAFNRLALRYRQNNAIYCAVYIDDILETRFPKKPPRIISRPASWTILGDNLLDFEEFIKRCNEAHE